MHLLFTTECTLNIIMFIHSYYSRYVHNQHHIYIVIIGDNVHRKHHVLDIVYSTLYPEWPHRQCIGLAFRRSRVRASLAAANVVIWSPHLHSAIRGAQGVLPCIGGGGNDQSIRSTVPDAIDRRWLWSTAIRSSPLEYFSSITTSSW